MDAIRLLIATFLAGLAWCAPAAAEPASAIPGVVAEGTTLELVREGFNGTEGPLAWPDGGLLFTETAGNRITHVAPSGELSTFLENTQGTNSLALRADGTLVGVHTAKPGIGVIYPKEKAVTWANAFDGVPFVRPNDLVADHRGGVYFTDTSSAPRADRPTPPPPSVNYVTPQGELRRLITDVARPNGIQLSRDERTLYLANTAGEYVLAYSVADDGSLSQRRDFARLAGFRQTENGGTSSGADGLAIDAEGRLYVATSLGVQVFTETGEALGVIAVPKPPQNLAFAGPDKRTLFIVGRGAVYRLPVLTPGFAGRAK